MGMAMELLACPSFSMGDEQATAMTKEKAMELLCTRITLLSALSPTRTALFLGVPQGFSGRRQLVREERPRGPHCRNLLIKLVPRPHSDGIPTELKNSIQKNLKKSEK